MRARIAACAIVGAIVALTAFATPAASGHAGPRSGARPDIVPIGRLGGVSGQELIGQWWARVLAIPAAENPLYPPNPPRCLTLGRRRPVASAAGVATDSGAGFTCVMEAGTPLFITATTRECSSAEPEPYRAETEEEQRACAVEIFDIPDIQAIRVSLDDGAPVDIHHARFQLVSPQMRTWLPEGAIFDAEAGPATFVAAGYGATTRRKLRVGEHRLTVEFEDVDGSTVSATSTLIVIPRS